MLEWCLVRSDSGSLNKSYTEVAVMSMFFTFKEKKEKKKEIEQRVKRFNGSDHSFQY
jgi:hypothetical protein